jgi:CopG family nickel-responsive transcriptional regulator
MQRITITLDDELVEQFETFLDKQGYNNRSEAIRDLIRERLTRFEPHQFKTRNCFATLTYVYDHHERDLSARMTEISHAHHDLIVSTLHVHLDHNNCLETAVLRGAIARVKAFADSVIAQPGVRHGKLYTVPAKTSTQTHKHGSDDKPHRHLHLEPIL